MRRVLSKDEETKRLHSPNVRFLQNRRGENEREKKRDEKKNTRREIESSDYRACPFLVISRYKLYYSDKSLTDKPAGSGDANLQLLLRPVRLGAVDPSQGVLLARGVRSFRISHSLQLFGRGS